MKIYVASLNHRVLGICLFAFLCLNYTVLQLQRSGKFRLGAEKKNLFAALPEEQHSRAATEQLRWLLAQTLLLV